MKLLVETKGSFMLMNGNQEIPHDRPAVVVATTFVQLRISLKQVAVHAELVDEATDAEFVKFWEECQGDSRLAIASFLSKFGVEALTEKGSDPEVEKDGDEADEADDGDKGKRRRGRKGKGNKVDSDQPPPAPVNPEETQPTE